MVTQPCCSGLDVVALCCCGVVVAVAAYLVLMLGVRHYEHALEYSVRGQCECVESPASALFSQDKDYAHKWRIFNASLCAERLSADFRFETRHDSQVYGVIDFCSGKDRHDWYEDQTLLIGDQQRQLEHVLHHWARRSGAELGEAERELVSKYYLIGTQSVDMIIGRV